MNILNSSEDDNNEEFYKASNLPSPSPQRNVDHRNTGANILVDNNDNKSQTTTFKRDDIEMKTAM